MTPERFFEKRRKRLKLQKLSSVVLQFCLGLSGLRSCSSQFNSWMLSTLGPIFAGLSPISSFIFIYLYLWSIIVVLKFSLCVADRQAEKCGPPRTPLSTFRKKFLVATYEKSQGLRSEKDAGAIQTLHKYTDDKDLQRRRSFRASSTRCVTVRFPSI
ncbi:hypothetical protein AB6A40_005796 [Gnathostoma spinigerum]|uniref:Uncharacterized protein n=1 Tax=Gnathostoma spinigerum TaxID=75299 RepID=A0ABD6ERA1_9BILA